MYSADRGFGFVRGDDGVDVFFHVRALALGGLEAIEVGDRVQYEIEQAPDGRARASKVELAGR
jgi:CspA family cold shock protein